MGLVLLAGTILAGAPQPATRAAPPASQPTTIPARIDWRADLRFLAKTISSKHHTAFAGTSADRFDEAVAELDGRIATLSDIHAYAALCRLASLIGDGHTRLFDDHHRIAPHIYGVQFAWLKDGIFVFATTEAERPLFRAQLLRIGDSPIEEALRKLTPLTSYDNEYGKQAHLLELLNNGDMLLAAGLIDDPDAAHMTLIDAAGVEREVALAPPESNARITVTLPAILGDALAHSRRPRDSGRDYGCFMIEGTGALYVWYDACKDQEGQPTVKAFTDQVLDFVADQSPERVIIDLRRNHGGDIHLLHPLMHGLAKDPATSNPGRVIGLIGRQTFSAAMFDAADLRKIAHAALIGMPTGGKPNSYGDTQQETLPSSGLRLQYTTKFFCNDPQNAPAVEPDVWVQPTSAEFFSPRDLTLETALAYTPPK